MSSLSKYSKTLDKCIQESECYTEQDELNVLIIKDQIKLYLMDREIVLKDAKEFGKGSRILVKSSNGTMVAKQSPNFVSMQQSLNQIKDSLRDLGLTAKARKQIISEVKEIDTSEDKLKEFMNNDEE